MEQGGSLRPQRWAPSTAKTNNHRTRNIKHSQHWRGDRSPADMVRQGSARQRVPGVFSLPNISWIWKGASQQLGNAKQAKKRKKAPTKSLLSPAKDLKRGSRTRTEHFQMKMVLTVAKHHGEAVAPIPPPLGKAKQELGCQPSLGCEANAECTM